MPATEADWGREPMPGHWAASRCLRSLDRSTAPELGARVDVGDGAQIGVGIPARIVAEDEAED